MLQIVVLLKGTIEKNFTCKVNGSVELTLKPNLTQFRISTAQEYLFILGLLILILLIQLSICIAFRNIIGRYIALKLNNKIDIIDCSVETVFTILRPILIICKCAESQKVNS